MKVVLLAAGRSKRMAPIPDKNLLKFFGKPLIVRQIEILIKAGFGEILIVGGKHNLEKIITSVSSNFKKAKIDFCQQENLDIGMAGAVISAEKWIGGEQFLLVSSNDVIGEDAYGLFKGNLKSGLILAKKVNSYFPGGYLKINKKGVVEKIVEKPGEGKEPSDLVNIVMHYHPNSKALIAALKKISSRHRHGGVKQITFCASKTTLDRDDRYERALQALFDAGEKYCALPYKGVWQPLKYPWHVLSVMNLSFTVLKKGLMKGKKVQIAKSAIIKGNVFLDDGCRVLENAVIQGPAYIGKNTVIATNALIRESHIGANCVIGFCSEVARSYVGDNVWTHTNYIGDSIIGNDVSFGAGSVTGNLRLDEGKISVCVDCGAKHISGDSTGDKVDSGMTKLGLITGDHIRIGVNVSFMPGIRVGSNSCVGPGIVVAQDIPTGAFVTGKWELKTRENRVKFTPRNHIFQ